MSCGDSQRDYCEACFSRAVSLLTTITNLYEQCDEENDDIKPLSGADFVEEDGMQVENHINPFLERLAEFQERVDAGEVAT